jgi:hypothetical protein
VRDSVPAAENVAVKVAVPELSAAVPMVPPPAEKVTVPVAAAGATVAVKFTPAPAATEELDEASVVVVAVEPVPVPVPVLTGGSQKPLQPARKSAAISHAAEMERAAGCTGRVRWVNMAERAFHSRCVRCTVVLDAGRGKCDRTTGSILAGHGFWLPGLLHD